jgi:hypothetical protein
MTIPKLPVTEGPLGFPMTDRQARNLDILLKQLPKSKEFEYKKTIFDKAATELNAGERSDVSWISTQAVDRYGHVMFAKGMNDSQYALNPVVTLNHDYSIPPIGRSLWRKSVKDGAMRGIKAKTVYPPRPGGWSETIWPPDKVFALIEAGLLNGKSIGWLPTKAHYADAKEITANNYPDNTLIVEEWLLIEYAVATIPVNPETVVEIVSKAKPMPAELSSALGWSDALRAGACQRLEHKASTPGRPIIFTPVGEITKAVERAIARIDLAKLVSDSIDRKRGRV